MMKATSFSYPPHTITGQNWDVIIVGAGAAGLMCAAQAGRRGKRVLLLDKAEKIGKKILISGGGRCNFSNLYIHPNAYLSRNPHFCKSALARYTVHDFLTLLRQYHLSWHEKTLGQLFCDQKAPAIVNMLWHECAAVGVTLGLNTQIELPIQRTSTNGFVLHTSQGTQYCQSLVIATGGPSIPRMGSTDFGVQLAKSMGLHSIPFKPALVPFTFSPEVLQGLFAGLSGLSTAVQACCNKACFRENLLFTHRGLSGPAMLQVSSYWQMGDAISIDLLPEQNAAEWLLHAKQSHPKTELKTILAKVLPARLVTRLCETRFQNRPLAQYGDKALQNIGEQLNHWVLYPSGTEGMRTAEVALGGVDTKELSSKTFEARKVPGLYFIGETVDVTGWLGGYNFQWAWASGWCAGQAV